MDLSNKQNLINKFSEFELHYKNGARVFLFQGDASTGKTTLALHIAEVLFNSPDFHKTKESLTSTYIMMSRTEKNGTSLPATLQTALNSNAKLIIIDECANLPTYLIDSLIPYLENRDKTLIFCTTNSDYMGEAFLSRCINIVFERMTYNELVEYSTKEIARLQLNTKFNTSLVPVTLATTYGTPRQINQILDVLVKSPDLETFNKIFTRDLEEDFRLFVEAVYGAPALALTNINKIKANNAFKNSLLIFLDLLLSKNTGLRTNSSVQLSLLTKDKDITPIIKAVGEILRENHLNTAKLMGIVIKYNTSLNPLAAPTVELQKQTLESDNFKAQPLNDKVAILKQQTLDTIDALEWR